MTSLLDQLQARFNAGSYTARKKDRRVGEKVALDAGVDKKVGNYWKNSLPCEELDLIRNISNAARDEYYRYSTEWLEGVRVMTTEAYHKYAPSFKEFKYQWQQAVDTFVANYPDLVRAAPDKLKELYDPADYPHPDRIAEKFYMEFRIFPFPDVDTDFRVKLIKDEIEEVKAQIRQDFADAQRSASQDLFNRIEERVKKMHEALVVPDKKLYDSMFQHTVDLCEDIRILNFAGDECIELLRKEMLSKLAGLNPELVRASSGIPGGQREQAAQAAKDILARVNQMRGL